MLEAKSGETAPSPRLKVKMQWQRPDWCKWVPLGSLQYVGDCTGSATGATSGTQQEVVPTGVDGAQYQLGSTSPMRAMLFRTSRRNSGSYGWLQELMPLGLPTFLAERGRLHRLRGFGSQFTCERNPTMRLSCQHLSAIQSL